MVLYIILVLRNCGELKGLADKAVADYNEYSLYYCFTTADSNTPQDIGSPKLKSPSGDKEQRNTVHGPSPGPGKNSSKDAVTCK